MRQRSIFFLCGFLFALGLGISDMTNPYKILRFLNIFGRWDATLIMVMFGAVLMFSIAYQWSLKLSKPLFESKFFRPSASVLDKRLVIGSALFGVGWGLSGFCPGPAITASTSGAIPALTVLASMLIGMLVFFLWDRSSRG